MDRPLLWAILSRPSSVQVTLQAAQLLPMRRQLLLLMPHLPLLQPRHPHRLLAAITAPILMGRRAFVPKLRLPVGVFAAISLPMALRAVIVLVHTPRRLLLDQLSFLGLQIVQLAQLGQLQGALPLLLQRVTHLLFRLHL